MARAIASVQNVCLGTQLYLKELMHASNKALWCTTA